jgi:plastocyanin
MRTSRVQLLVAVGALALAAACGNDDDNDTNANPTPSAGAATYAVQVDANRADLNLPATEFVLGYFPKALSVHPGDTVSFGLNDSGEPHTIALGSLANTAATSFAALSPAAQQAASSPEGLSKFLTKNSVPELLPPTGGDAIQAASQPCYQATGTPPLKNACAVHTGDFTGSEALVGSGWLDPNAPFSLKISDAAKAGTYHYFCQLHGPAMGGTLTVTDKATSVPSPADAKATADTELRAATAMLAPAAATLPTATASKALAGAFNPAFPGGAVAAFGPSNVKVKVGGTVSWTINGPHVIYFNAPTDAQQLRVAAPDGSVHFNPKAAIPVGGPPPPTKPGLFNGGSCNGVGPHNSGPMISFPPNLYTYKLTFTKAGTYNFLCTFHTNMKGTVTVG